VRQVFRNLDRALRGSGSALSRVVKFTTYLSRTEDLDRFLRSPELFAELYPDGVYPPNTLLMITGLVSPAFLVEIEAVAEA
jgi:enamine deaminase RidA (YjgF/YER057c/UK114 family)